MFKRKLIAMGLILTIAVGIVCGCTNNTTQLQTTTMETTPQETATTQVETTEVTTTERVTTEEATTEEMDKGVMGRVDAEDICKHISVNGKYVEFPWTLNELGDDYDFSEERGIDLEEKKGSAFLLYKGEIIALISAKIEDELTRDSLIYFFNSWGHDNIILYDLNTNTTKEDAFNRFGKPKGEFENSYLYYTEEIHINVDFRLNKVSGFTILLEDEYINATKEAE